jgi:hypothetical protein
MLLIQVFAYVVSSTPYTVISFYLVLKTNLNVIDSTDDSKSVIMFILFITNMLRFVCPFISFYLFLLVSPLYQKEMRIIILSVCNRRHLLWERQNGSYHNGSIGLTQNSKSIRQIASRQQQKLTIVLPSVRVD